MPMRLISSGVWAAIINGLSIPGTQRMTRKRSLVGFCALAALLFASAALRAADPATAPVLLTGSNPKDIEELKAIQEKVEAVIKKNLPATVGIMIGNGQGSGVIVNKDGTVLTAGHVSADPGQPCLVIMPDGKRLHAKSLGNNAGIDSGMIKITDKAPDGGWPTVEMGTAANLQAGEWTVALGHPGGYRKDRPPVARLGRVLLANPRLIATDNTLINGDSGGPLFDLSGKLIGIHSRIGTSSSQNIHVPIDTYTQTWDRLAAGEAWGHSLLGADAPTSPAVLGVTVVESDTGCKISRVNDNSPAARAGLKVGDIITKFNSRDVKTPEEMVDLMSRMRPGRNVTLALVREDKPLEITARLAARTE